MNWVYGLLICKHVSSTQYSLNMHSYILVLATECDALISGHVDTFRTLHRSHDVCPLMSLISKEISLADSEWSWCKHGFDVAYCSNVKASLKLVLWTTSSDKRIASILISSLFLRLQQTCHPLVIPSWLLSGADSLLTSGSVTRQMNAIQHKSKVRNAPLHIIRHLNLQTNWWNSSHLSLSSQLYLHSDTNQSKI